MLKAKVLAIFLAGALCQAVLAADNAAYPGDVTLEAPTIHCLGVRWLVGGDANSNAKVLLKHRKAGQSEWRKALPLFAATREALVNKPPEGTTLFAGSILGLAPDTSYELELTLVDTDGGGTQKMLEAHTRGEPVAPKPLRTLYVVPGDGGGSGTKADPFRGLPAAVKNTRPGDLVLLGKGSYHATVTITASGTKEHPIIYRAAGDSEAVIDGGTSADNRPERGVSASDIHDVWFEGLSVRDVHWGVVAHRSQRIVMRRCHICRVSYGFTCTNNTVLTEDFFLADNVLEGPSIWPRSKGIEDARGFQVSGRGHVVCYNRISGFADAIDTFGSQECSAIDIYGNEIINMTDDGIEADYSQHNVRVFNNRLTNCFQGISEQPVFGGPVYILRNAMYNVQVEPFKMHTAGEDLTSGFMLFHNTCVKQGMPWGLWTSNRVNNAVTRNNLFVGTAANYAMEFTAPMEQCNFDYDGFGGGPFRTFAKWNSVRYSTFAEFISKSPIEHHAVLVDPLRLFASGIRPPQNFKMCFSPTDNDLRLKPGCAAVDVGQPIPNINDNFVGAAPDLGAYEVGQDLPHYGPRPPSR